MAPRTLWVCLALCCVAASTRGQDSVPTPAPAALPVAADTAVAGEAATPIPAAATDTLAPLNMLAGELPAVVKRDGSPYVVTGDIIVAPGKSVSIEPGVCFLFRNFTGLQVHGTLTAVGTKEQPIAFTSEHDKKHGSRTNQDPAPYDWNGITVTENAVGTKFEYCRVGYSLFGINAMTDYFTIKDCMFRQNGRADVTIKGTKQAVVAGTAFSYEPLGKMPTLGQPQRKPARTVIQTVSAAIFVVGCAAGVWKATDYSKSKESLAKVSDASDLANLRNPNIINDWESAKATRSTDLYGMIAGFGVGAVGAVVFTITLF